LRVRHYRLPEGKEEDRVGILGDDSWSAEFADRVSVKVD
jgi:hypothetical protein